MLDFSKRQRVILPFPNKLDLSSQHGFNIQCLEDDQYIEGTVISEILNAACALSPFSTMCMDTLISNHDSIPQRIRARFLAQRDMVVLYPLNLASKGRHWVLVVASAASVNILDSLPSATDEQELKNLLRSLLSLIGEATAPAEPPTATHVPCPRQSNTTDCGVAVIVNGLYAVACQDVPATTDYALWRRILLAFSTGRRASKGILTHDSEELLTVSTCGTPLPPAPPTKMTQAEFISWDKQYQRYRREIKTSAQRQLNVARTRYESVLETLEDIIGVFGRLQLAGSSRPGVDQIQEELANCHSAMQSLSRLRQPVTAMKDELETVCIRLAQAQNRRAMVQLEMVKMEDAIRDEYEALHGRLATLGLWDVLNTEDAVEQSTIILRGSF
ncbi:Ulp1 protease family protein [Colletotrichum tofieldiae]|nr:Ulp1 protease family protein [Colletotrichum tofieldiae]